jgi:hypothetical protein
LLKELRQEKTNQQRQNPSKKDFSNRGHSESGVVRRHCACDAKGEHMRGAYG